MNGRKTERGAIRIYVSRKVPESKLKNDQVISEEISEIVTDVVEIGKIRALGRRSSTSDKSLRRKED